MRARILQLQSFGSAQSSLDLKTVELPEPGEGQVLLQLEASPIHPADLNIIEGKYGLLPSLPAVMGNEGVGRVISYGKGVKTLQIGDLVLLKSRGVWAEAKLADAEDCILLPKGLDVLQAAQISINPSTAYLMLTQLLPHPLARGNWIVQNAANSAVGRCVIQIARCLGLKTLNVVRRAALKEELLDLGANAVVTEDEDLKAAAENFCGKQLPRLALNAVGGASALALANALADEGVHVTYGAMARQPLKIPNGLLIFKGLVFRGFWLTHQWKSMGTEQKQILFQQLVKWMTNDSLYLPVEKVYALENYLEAIAHAQREKRAGKVVFQFN